ncbi:MAG: hypothetical protein IPH81_19005 [Candidatus Microthrix sp.]|nr:hypothetical protein [Candidatus Microthrix sp.]
MPLRDLFAALFFVLFWVRTDPSDLPPVLVTAAVLANVTRRSPISTGRLACPAGRGPKGRDRAGMEPNARRVLDRDGLGRRHRRQPGAGPDRGLTC